MTNISPVLLLLQDITRDCQIGIRPFAESLLRACEQALLLDDLKASEKVTSVLFLISLGTEDNVLLASLGSFDVHIGEGLVHSATRADHRQSKSSGIAVCSRLAFFVQRQSGRLVQVLTDYSVENDRHSVHHSGFKDFKRRI